MTKKMRKPFYKVLSLTLALLLVIPILADFQVKAADNEGTLTKMQAWVTPTGGSSILVASSDSADIVDTLGDSIAQNSQFKIRYDFKAPADVSTDSYAQMIFKLPNEFDATALKNIHGNNYIDASPNHDYFSYSFDDTEGAKKLTVTFLHDGLNRPNPNAGAGAECFIEVVSDFSLNANDTLNPKEISIPFTDTVTKTFSVRFEPNTAKNAITKKGEFISTPYPGIPAEQLKINPHEIKWTIDVNTKLKSIPQADAVLIDTFNSAQLQYQPGSLKVYPLIPKMNGESNLDAALTETTHYTINTSTDGQVQLTFENNQMQDINSEKFLTKSYRIEYITDIKPEVVGTNIKIDNTAKFNKEKDVATASVTIDRKIKDQISKGVVYMVVYNGTADKNWLRWTIVTNTSQRNIVSIEDTLPDPLELIKFGKNPENSDANTTDNYEKFRVRRIKQANLHDHGASSTYEELTPSELKNLFTITYEPTSRLIKFEPKTPAAARDAYAIQFDTKGNNPGAQYTNTVTTKTTPGASSGVFTASRTTGTLAGEITKALDRDSAIFNASNNPGKYNHQIDYENRILRWRTNIDPKAGRMKDLVIEDTFPNDGLIMVDFDDPSAASISKYVEVYRGATKIDSSKYTVTPTLSDGKTIGYRISFNNDMNSNNDSNEGIKEVHTIYYKTKFDRNLHKYKDNFSPVNHTSGVNITPSGMDERHLYRNQIKSDWKDKDGRAQTSTKANHFPAHNYVKYNGYKIAPTSIDPATREMEWLIYTNFNGEDIATTLTDTIGVGHELVSGSFSLKTYTINRGTGTPQTLSEIKAAAGNDVNSGFTIEENPNKDGFRVNIDQTTRRIAVIYKTVLKEEKSINNYTNTVNMYGSNIPATYTFPSYNRFIIKDGTQVTHPQKDWFIEWTLKMNESLSKQENLVIKDILSADQEYDMESFKLYRLPDETTPITNTDLPHTIDVKPVMDGGQDKFQMTLSINVPITHSYMLKYKTIVIKDDAPFDTTNKATISGSNVTAGNNTSNKNVSFAKAATTSGSRSKLSSISINKKLPDGTTLQNIQFELWKNGEKIKDFAPTDSSGLTKISKLPAGTYQIKETPSSLYQPINPITVVLGVNENKIEQITNHPIPSAPLVPYVPTPVTPADGSDKPKDDPKKPNEESGKEPGTDSGKDPDKETEKEPGTEPGTTPSPTPTPEPSPTPTPEAEQPEQPKLPSSTVVNTPLESELNINDDDIPTTLVQPKNGKVEIIGKKIIYTPDKDFVGKDKFTVQITRPDGSTYEEEIEIDVEVPKGSTKLPKTAGTAAFLFFILGTMMLSLGFWSKRK